MKTIRNKTATIILLAVLAFAFAGCGRDANIEEAVPAEETPEPRWSYQTKTAEIAAGEEAVLFQQACDDSGFLALINRKTGDRIPAELLEDESFADDGRYDIYESALFRVTENGKREKIRRYRPLPAPEDTEEREAYYSESRPRAFSLMPDGNILAVESSYESWYDATQNPMHQTRNRYYVRLLQKNGIEISCHEIGLEPEQGALDCTCLQIVGEAMAAMPQGNSVLFFNTEGVSCFSVTTPFPVKDLCWLGEDRLAVILRLEDRQWISLIDTAVRTATVPTELPQGAYAFCCGERGDNICFLRNTEVFSLNVEDGSIRKVTSLLSVGVNPYEVGAFFVREDGSLHFLLHAWQPDQTTKECYTVASLETIPSVDAVSAEETEVSAAAEEKREITISFLRLSDSLIRGILKFNADSSDCVLLPLDYANLGRESFFADEHQLVVMDEPAFERFRDDKKLEDLQPLLNREPSFAGQNVFPSIIQALSDKDGSLCALTPVFYIETMAANQDAVGGKTQLSFGELKELAAQLPYGGGLYEPYYTAGRLLKDLMTVNRNAEGLHETMTEFARLQPMSYNYRDYTADSSSMESRIYEGRLLLMQARIGTLEELKWYDAFFPSGACFVGWPKPDGSASILRFDELIGIRSGLDAEDRAAAWKFVSAVLREEDGDDCYGFPIRRKALDEMMDRDAADAVYVKDEKGRWKLDEEGDRIEAARDSWYSPEGRRRYEYALTEEQRTKLLTMIEDAA